jgi:putative hydrolase of HD superfamily
MKRNQNTHKGSEDIWEYARENLIEKNVKKGKIIDDSNE